MYEVLLILMGSGYWTLLGSLKKKNPATVSSERKYYLMMSKIYMLGLLQNRLLLTAAKYIECKAWHNNKKLHYLSALVSYMLHFIFQALQYDLHRNKR